MDAQEEVFALEPEEIADNEGGIVKKAAGMQIGIIAVQQGCEFMSFSASPLQVLECDLRRMKQNTELSSLFFAQ